MRNARFSCLFLPNKFFFEGSSVARLLANKFMKIELLYCFQVLLSLFLATSVATSPPPHRATPPAATALQAHPRAKVEQSSESTGSARIRRQLMIMVTASRGVKPHTGQPQSTTCESTLAPGCTVAQHHLRLPLPRDKPAVQAPAIGALGTQRRRRGNQETLRYRIGQEKTPVAPKA